MFDPEDDNYYLWMVLLIDGLFHGELVLFLNMKLSPTEMFSISHPYIIEIL